MPIALTARTASSLQVKTLVALAELQQRPPPGWMARFALVRTCVCMEIDGCIVSCCCVDIDWYIVLWLYCDEVGVGVCGAGHLNHVVPGVRLSLSPGPSPST